MANIEDTVKAAKAFLQKSENGEPSTYDHMVNVIKNILNQRPDNVLSNFENISRETKREAFKGDEDRLQEDTVKSSSIENAMKKNSVC